MGCKRLDTDFFSFLEIIHSKKNASKEKKYVNAFEYVYQYKDHLQNIRLSYSDINNDSSIDASTEILEEKNYYPFGMTHKGYNNIVNSNANSVASKFQFQGVELEEALGLNLMEMEFRNYDPALGRFTGIDPVTHHSMSPYVCLLYTSDAADE